MDLVRAQDLTFVASGGRNWQTRKHARGSEEHSGFLEQRAAVDRVGLG